jgi:hypothetical protein
MIDDAAASLGEFDQNAHARNIRPRRYQERSAGRPQNLRCTTNRRVQIGGLAVHHSRGGIVRIRREQCAASRTSVGDNRCHTPGYRHTHVVAQQTAERAGHIIEFLRAANVRHFSSAFE